MNVPHTDALVFFGATGDLTYKKILPALYAMERRGHLNVPVIAVARSAWTLEHFRARARDSSASSMRRVRPRDGRPCNDGAFSIGPWSEVTGIVHRRPSLMPCLVVASLLSKG